MRILWQIWHLTLGCGTWIGRGFYTVTSNSFSRELWLFIPLCQDLLLRLIRWKLPAMKSLKLKWHRTLICSIHCRCWKKPLVNTAFVIWSAYQYTCTNLMGILCSYFGYQCYQAAHAMVRVWPLVRSPRLHRGRHQDHSDWYLAAG